MNVRAGASRAVDTQGTLFGSTYEPGYPPVKTNAQSRDKWLDGALLEMVRQAKAMKLANQLKTRPRRR
jgi:hypothetical protein